MCNEMFLMSTHHICFYEEIRKHITELSPNNILLKKVPYLQLCELTLLLLWLYSVVFHHSLQWACFAGQTIKGVFLDEKRKHLIWSTAPNKVLSFSSKKY